MKRNTKVFKALVFFIVLFLVLSFAFRNVLLKYFIGRYAESIKQTYGLQLKVGKSNIHGLSTVYLDDLFLIQTNHTAHKVGDTIFYANKIHFELSILKLIATSLYINNAEIDTCNVNFSALSKVKSIRKQEKSSDKIPDLTAYFEKTDQLLFNTVPAKFSINSFKIYTVDSLNKIDKVVYADLNIEKSKLNANIMLNYYGNNRLIVDGRWERKNAKLSFKLFAKNKTGFLLKKMDKNNVESKIGFDTLQFKLEKNKTKENQFDVKFVFNKLAVSNPKVSKNEVHIQYMKAEAHIQFTENRILMDSLSSIQINNLKAHFSAFAKPFSPKEFGFTFAFTNIPATTFFSSLPQGMFNVVRSVEAKGNLSFRTEFYLNTLTPDSLKFNASLRKQNFSITNYGSSNLLKMNSDFEYTAYENGAPFRTFTVGSANPGFTPLESISSHLKNAVLTSEDGSFFYHRGFNEDAFRQSIALNFTRGKFVRGGSTISMQLVKNVFLNRNKNISRKLEEALIVWLIENNRLCSKERMFEVYLNIIEWGPGVYGAKEAADFYFKKKPSELNLAESIFMASIVPRPKSFKYSFDKEGKLKGSLAGFYRLVSQIMLKKELISQEEFDGLLPTVELKGIAKSMVLPSDSLVNDSLFIDESKFLD